MPARKLVNNNITRITGVIFFMSIPPKVRYPSPRNASYLYYGPYENGEKLPEFAQKCRISAYSEEIWRKSGNCPLMFCASVLSR